MGFAQAQNQASYTEETAKLLEQVNLKTIDGREMAEVPLKLVLHWQLIEVFRCKYHHLAIKSTSCSHCSKRKKHAQLDNKFWLL